MIKQQLLTVPENSVPGRTACLLVISKRHFSCCVRECHIVHIIRTALGRIHRMVFGARLGVDRTPVRDSDLKQRRLIETWASRARSIIDDPVDQRLRACVDTKDSHLESSYRSADTERWAHLGHDDSIVISVVLMYSHAA